MSDATSRPWFRWAAGMRTACGLRVYAVDTYGQALGVRENDRRARPEVCALPHDAVPDWTDAATIGALTGLVRRMTGDPRLYVRPNADGVGWMIVSLDLGWAFMRPTELAALLAACDAAPVNTTTTKDTP